MSRDLQRDLFAAFRCRCLQLELTRWSAIVCAANSERLQCLVAKSFRTISELRDALLAISAAMMEINNQSSQILGFCKTFDQCLIRTAFELRVRSVLYPYSVRVAFILVAHLGRRPIALLPKQHTISPCISLSNRRGSCSKAAHILNEVS